MSYGYTLQHPVLIGGYLQQTPYNVVYTHYFSLLHSVHFAKRPLFKYCNTGRFSVCKSGSVDDHSALPSTLALHSQGSLLLEYNIKVYCILHARSWDARMVTIKMNSPRKSQVWDYFIHCRLIAESFPKRRYTSSIVIWQTIQYKQSFIDHSRTVNKAWYMRHPSGTKEMKPLEAEQNSIMNELHNYWWPAMYGRTLSVMTIKVCILRWMKDSCYCYQLEYMKSFYLGPYHVFDAIVIQLCRTTFTKRL